MQSGMSHKVTEWDRVLKQVSHKNVHAQVVTLIHFTEVKSVQELFNQRIIEFSWWNRNAQVWDHNAQCQAECRKAHNQ